jgi:hypothetical protein
MAIQTRWQMHPRAQELVSSVVGTALQECPAAQDFAAHLLKTAGIRLADTLDHVVFEDVSLQLSLQRNGWQEISSGVLRHDNGLFPDFVRGAGLQVAFRAESLETFIAVHRSSGAVQGPQFGPYRRVCAFERGATSFWAVERNGHVTYDMPSVSPARIRSARLCLQAFRSRRRQFDSVAQGLAHTELLVDAAVAALGQHWACDLFLRAEREYWMQRCDAGRFQYSRQCAAGVGWVNIDHHTYDSSREHFAPTVRILEKLGYICRELFYAGAQAGWGSQILEQPVLRSTIFADIDLAPDELDLDFAHLPIEPLPKMRRAGIWCGMHGESMLEAGLNHVAGMYDQNQLRAQLSACGVRMMAPFSSFPELYQELTEGQWWPVDPVRVDCLQQAGHLAQDEAEDFRLRGAIGSHLENLERNQGYKGFNQPGIDGVLRIIDPRQHVLAERV